MNKTALKVRMMKATCICETAILDELNKFVNDTGFMPNKLKISTKDFNHGERKTVISDVSLTYRAKKK